MGVAEIFQGQVRGNFPKGMHGRHTNTNIETFPLISFAYIFWKKTESRL